MKLITHNGSFHADDVLSCVVLASVVDGVEEIVRSRKIECSDGDFFVDVGMKYSPEEKRYDHHQPEFDIKVEDSEISAYGKKILKSAFGLIWDDFGVKYLEKIGKDYLPKEFEELSDVERNFAFLKIKSDFVLHVDAYDCGTTFGHGTEIALTSLIEKIKANKEEKIEGLKVTDDDFEKSPEIAWGFCKAFNFAKTAFEGFCIDQLKLVSSITIIKKSELTSDGKILVSEENIGSLDLISEIHKNVNFVVSKDKKGSWAVRTIKQDKYNFTPKVPISNKFAGKSKEEVAKSEAISDLVFAHKLAFIAITNSKESALKIATISNLDFESKRKRLISFEEFSKKLVIAHGNKLLFIKKDGELVLVFPCGFKLIDKAVEREIKAAIFVAVKERIAKESAFIEELVSLKELFKNCHEIAAELFKKEELIQSFDRNNGLTALMSVDLSVSKSFLDRYLKEVTIGYSK